MNDHARPPDADRTTRTTPDDPLSNAAPPSSRSRSKRNSLIALPVVVLLLALGWLFSAEAQPPAAPTDLADLPRVDGTLSVVEADRLVMTLFEPLDGQDEMQFVVPEKYAANFDLAHLRSHSSVGIPTRIYYLAKQQDGAWIAVYKADAPANGSAGQ